MEVWAVAVTPKPCQLDQQHQSVASLPQQGLAVSKVADSAVASAADEAADSEEDSVAVTEDLAEEEEVSDTKVVVDSVEEEAERLMAIVTQRHPLMPLQVQAETEVVSEVGTEAPLLTAA